MDNAARFRIESGRTRVDLIASAACLVDAFACVIFLILPTTKVGLLCIVLVVDQITCIVGYCGMYKRLVVIKPKLAELGFYLLISGTLILTCHNVVEASARLNFLALNYLTADRLHLLVELLVTFTLAFGLAIYAWIIVSSPPLRRWLGFMMGIQGVLLFMALGSFTFPWLSNFVTSPLITIYAVILAVAKAVWFLSPLNASLL